MATGTKIGTAYFTVDADTTKAEKSIQDLGSTTGSVSSGMASKLSAISGSMTAVGAVAGVAIAGKAIGALVDLGKASVEAASALGESVNAINVVFGDAAGGILRLGETATTQFGLSQRAFNDFAVRFSAFAENIAKQSGQQVVDVVEDMTTRIADFASVMNLDMEEAATVVQSALAGETEAFRRFGGDVSAAAVQQKALQLGLGATSDELTEQEKILARYTLIMEQTDEMAGDFANTSDSLANQQRILTGAVEDLQAKIGGFLVPAVAKGTGALADLTVIADELIGKLQDFQVASEEAGVPIGDIAVGVAGSIPIIGNLVIGLDHATAAWDFLADKLSTDATAGLDEVTFATETGTAALEKYNDMAHATFDTTLNGQAVLDGYNRKAAEVAEANRRMFETQEDATQALKDHQDAMRAAVDPFFNLQQAASAFEEAQAKVNEMVANGTTDTPEYTAALFDLTRKSGDLTNAQANMRTATGQSDDALALLMEQAGLTTEQIDIVNGAIDRYNANRIDAKTLELIVKSRHVGGGGVLEGTQIGGHVERGVPIIVGEAGPEVFVPANSGQVYSNTQSAGILGGTTANIVINLHGGATRGDAIMVGDAVEDALRRVAAGRTVR